MDTQISSTFENGDIPPYATQKIDSSTNSSTSSDSQSSSKIKSSKQNSTSKSSSNNHQHLNGNSLGDTNKFSANRPVKEVRVGSTAEEIGNNVETPAFQAPDGGWGWMVVLGSFMIHVIADGITYSFGSYTRMFVDDFKSSRWTIGWLSSILAGMTLASGPLASILSTKYGFRSVTVAGAIMASIGFMMPYLCPSLWILFVFSATLTGLGFGLMYLPAIVTVGIYFDKRRSIAIGLAVCGAGIGTFVINPLTEFLLETVEYSWSESMLVMSAIILNCIACGLLFRPLKDLENAPDTNAIIHLDGGIALDHEYIMDEDPGRNSAPSSSHDIRGVGKFTPMAVSYLSLSQPHSNSDHPNLLINSLMSMQTSSRRHSTQTVPKEKRNWSPLRAAKRMFHAMIDMETITDPIFVLFGVSNFFTSIGFNIPFVYIKDRGIEMGLLPPEAGNLITCLGVGNVCGRIIFGFMSSRPWCNRLILYNTALVFCGVITFLSNYCKTFWLMAAYSIGFGMLSGVYVTLTSVVLVDLLGVEKLNESFGLTMLFQGIAVFVGPPLGGWLVDNTKSFDVCFGATGFVIGLSGLMLYPIPILQRYLQRKKDREMISFNSNTA